MTLDLRRLIDQAGRWLLNYRPAAWRWRGSTARR
jgi:hypothetical protein